MEQLDKKVLIHVCTELIIIGGIAFWLNSKINSQEATIARLEKENKELAERLKKIEIFLQNIYGQQQSSPTSKPSKKKKKKSQSPTASEEESIIKSSEHEIEI